MRSCYTESLSPTRLAIADVVDYYGLGKLITRINVPMDEARGSRMVATMKFSIGLNIVLSMLLAWTGYELLLAGAGWEQCLSKPKPDVSKECVAWWFGGETNHEAARRRMCGVRK